MLEALVAVTIQDFKDAWADKPNRDKAFAIAEQYVAENEGILEPILGGKTSDELVAVVSLARAAGNDEMATAVTIWELVKFERKQIGGVATTRPVNLPTPLRQKGG